jgi:hypothetical protein
MRKLLAILSTVVLLAAVTASGATAASPHQVDPAAMTPPLNPSYDNWACSTTGAGPICRASLNDAWANLDTGLSCGGRPIYETGTYESNPVRWHLPDGRAVKTFDPETLDIHWTLSPTGGGPTVDLFSQWNLHFIYPDPGNRDTRVLTSTGSYWQVTAKGHGLVWHDIGLVQFAPGSGDDIVFFHGPADSSYGNLDLVMADVCAILVNG